LKKKIEKVVTNKKDIQNIVNKKNILISLPLDVSRFFLNNWLEITNICFLDNGFCSNNIQRIVFLNILNG
jgi:hypothetical protein